ncbi:MAG: pyrroline-5-carboxylate reductase [Actinomycetota bacterium]
MNELLVVGGGKMGEALIGGLLAAEWTTPDGIVVVEPVEARRDELAKAHDGIGVVPDVGSAPPLPDVLVAVKPNHCEEVCRGLERRERVLSIAAGVTTESLDAWLPDGARAVRAMPNTPALVGCGMAAICGGAAAGPDDLSWASEILSAVGEVVVLSEAHMDAVTGVSGSGPAYVFLMAEAMVDAAVAVGLDPGTADTLVRQTLLGASKLLAESGEPPARLRENVTSPGGTTAAGLDVFAQRDYRGVVADVVAAATARSVELGQG